mmetsp:Transcript_28828/g.74000  ORF Transcript_28828/g.74000 Transcript_28828/m.74000 type:complete len:323 (-) Transcript_28828:9-977(-)
MSYTLSDHWNCGPIVTQRSLSRQLAALLPRPAGAQVRSKQSWQRRSSGAGAAGRPPPHTAQRAAPPPAGPSCATGAPATAAPCGAAQGCWWRCGDCCRWRPLRAARHSAGSGPRWALWLEREGGFGKSSRHCRSSARCCAAVSLAGMTYSPGKAAKDTTRAAPSPPGCPSAPIQCTAAPYCSATPATDAGVGSSVRLAVGGAGGCLGARPPSLPSSAGSNTPARLVSAATRPAPYRRPLRRRYSCSRRSWKRFSAARNAVHAPGPAAASPPVQAQPAGRKAVWQRQAHRRTMKARLSCLCRDARGLYRHLPTANAALFLPFF